MKGSSGYNTVLVHTIQGLEAGGLSLGGDNSGLSGGGVDGGLNGGGCGDDRAKAVGVIEWSSTVGDHLGDLMAHHVSGGLHNGSARNVRDTDGDSAGFDDGGLHTVSMSLMSGVSEVAAKTVALDDGRVVRRSTDDDGRRNDSG